MVLSERLRAVRRAEADCQPRLDHGDEPFLPDPRRTDESARSDRRLGISVDDRQDSPGARHDDLHDRTPARRSLSHGRPRNRDGPRAHHRRRHTAQRRRDAQRHRSRYVSGYAHADARVGIRGKRRAQPRHRAGRTGLAFGFRSSKRARECAARCAARSAGRSSSRAYGHLVQVRTTYTRCDQGSLPDCAARRICRDTGRKRDRQDDGAFRRGRPAHTVSRKENRSGKRRYPAPKPADAVRQKDRARRSCSLAGRAPERNDPALPARRPPRPPPVRSFRRRAAASGAGQSSAVRPRHPAARRTDQRPRRRV